ncbi:MAG TPA: VWA domain-containing protein [Bryobacteraceae bacterium]|nr:VWA domain-containing protein [Bryobacteraceae bacterium]
MHTRRTFLRQAGLALGAGPLGAQEGPTFSSDVKVISVLATVRTKDGAIVQDLTKDDFILTEDGRRQTIRYFSRETNLPLVLGLLVDTSGSQRMVLGEEQEASYRFLEKVLREEVDKTFLVHFDYRPEVLQNLTSSRVQLEKALERLTLPFQYRGGGGTTLYDAVYLCSNLITKKLTGRKAFVLLTDGEDHGSRVPIEMAIEAAQRADTLLYSILFSDDTFAGGFGGGDGKGVLRKMSRETGGGFFEVSKKRSLETIYDQLQEELRNQYSFGYTPDGTGKGKAFRAIRVATRRPGLVVQARSGYYAN